MEFIFLNAAGTTLFTRTDIESGHWVQQEMSVTADFPFVAGKVIQRGQRIAFRDPATDSLEVFEIRNVVTTEPDHYQQLTAEHIAISELQDEHMNKVQITDKTAAQALTTVLTGTLWSLGNNTASGTQVVEISRGSVWDAVNTIQSTWNVYITPRITISSAGAITGRYLDVAPAGGTFRGVRLSVRKNLIDPAVTYDDEDLYTAIYGYGGNVDKAQQTGDDKKEELTFKDVVWTATAEHPAKPSGQTYLEWPEKTALYGRNGRPRYGYYQNANIKDATILLQKTWETLQKLSSPKIGISGTVVDLYRLGYTDQPLRLHDIAIVEIEETGELFNKEITMLDVDLVDQSGNMVDIGDYVPNIVYINRETDKKAGGGGGGSGGSGMTNLIDETVKTYTDWVKTDEMIGMVVGVRNGNNYVKAGQIILAINNSGESGSYESAAYINANHVNISATSTAHLLAGSIVYDAQGNLVLKESSGGGVYVEHNDSGTLSQFGIWDKGNLTGGVMVQQINGQTGQTITRIIGDRVVVGDASSIDADYRGKTLDGTLTAITSDFTTVNTLLANKIEASDINATTVQAAISSMNQLTVNQLAASTSIGCTGAISGAEIWQGGSRMNLIDASVSLDGKTLTITRATGGAINFNKGGEYEQGWNDCIAAATLVTRYTRQATQYGGNDNVHYIIQYGQYTNVGSGWYKTTQANAYTLPDPYPTT